MTVYTSALMLGS